MHRGLIPHASAAAPYGSAPEVSQYQYIGLIWRDNSLSVYSA